MGFLDSLFQGIQDFAESDTYKKMVEKSDQIKAQEIERTTGKNGLRCYIDSMVDSGYNVCCKGTIKNIGRSSYSKVEVIVVFKDKDGYVVDKRTSIVFYGTIMYPGESMPFSVLSSAQNIKSATASIGNYTEE